MLLKKQHFNNYLGSLGGHPGNSEGGDFCCNYRRGLIALISSKRVAEYNLYDVVSSQIINRAKWKDNHKGSASFFYFININLRKGLVVSLDMNKEGEKIVGLDMKGNFTVSTIDTDLVLYDHRIGRETHSST